MARLINLVVIFFSVGLFVFAGATGLKTGQQNTFKSHVGEAQGTVMAFDAGLLVVEFSNPVVNSCGDTQIFGFITTPGGFSTQLKPIFIPAAKAGSINDSVLIFPVWDIMAFLSDHGAYTLEFYIDNNCSLFFNQTITLPPVPMVLERGGVKL